MADTIADPPQQTRRQPEKYKAAEQKKETGGGDYKVIRL